jgi:bacillithiol biosynthesis deacetylase BshB2
VKILVILPHPDDEAFGISGSLIKYIREEGAHVTYACLTLGEMGRNMGTPPFANRVTLPLIRREELREAADAIGLQDLRMLGFHDKMVEFEDPNYLDGVLRDCIAEVQPDIIYTFYPGYSVHPDHDATGASVVRIVEALPAAHRPVVRCLAFSHDCRAVLGEPDGWVDIRAYLPQKLKVLSAHRSQVQLTGVFQELADAPEIPAHLAERYGKEHYWTYKFE